MRRWMTTLHRWFGLLSALFLFVSGATGAFIAWDHELDELLNPRFFRALHPSPGVDEKQALALADRLERADARLQVTWLPLSAEPGHTLLLSVEPRRNPATQKPYELGFNQVALDPQTAEIQAQREWGAVSLARENFLPFMYKLHYTMHIPDGFGYRWGELFMGAIAIVWVLDCFIALWISFPNRKVWRKSLQFRFAKGGHKLNFDLHRSGGVWTWGFLLVIAVTAVSMNLRTQVVKPIVSVFSTLTPDPFDAMAAEPLDKPGISREQLLARARADAAQRGWTRPVGALLFTSLYGVIGAGFFEPGNDHGDGTLGNEYLYYRGKDGAPAGSYEPGRGTAGDLFMQAQFPLHSGRLFGVVGRIVVSVLGAAVAMLSITGVVIWARRKRSRTKNRMTSVPAGNRSSEPVLDSAYLRE